MGKSGKNQKHLQKNQRHHGGGGGEDDDVLPSSAYNLPSPSGDQVGEEEEGNGDGEGGGEEEPSKGIPSKFDLYQRSVQSPRGDISYLQKFFLMYVGGRMPLHLQEDFCGTALLSSVWLRSDPRRTAVGLDLDVEALEWCLENNLTKVGADGYSRSSFFMDGCSDDAPIELESDSTPQVCCTCSTMKDAVLPARDIICAFNYSCCCLQRRADLVSYFKRALQALSRNGGIFVMDVYGGLSSERNLRLQRKFPDFTYVWEQAEFDIINRRTRISLHFHLGKNQILRHAFSYNWRLWSLPEIKDCLEEAGFHSVHFWLREMPNTQENGNMEKYNARYDVKYEELSSFDQRDAWNAYVVGVANVRF